MAASVPLRIPAVLRRKLAISDRIAKRACEKSLLTYVRDAWPVLEPVTPFLLNWHHEALAEYLEAVTAGQIKRLVINVPPRHTKSRMVSVLWPTWCWARAPGDRLSENDILSGAASRWIFASYADELSTEHSRDRRTVLESPWYQRRWGDRVAFSRDQNRKTNYQNAARGAMFAVSIAGAAGLGAGGDAIIIDDPHDTKSAESEADRKAAIETFRSTLSTRHNDKKRGVIVVIMQRLNELDLAGYVLELGGWEHLKIEGECEERRVYSLPRSHRRVIRETDHTEIHAPDGALLARLEDGGLLWPAREGPKEIAERKLNLGSVGFAAQYQQRPAPKGGALFKAHWWRYWRAMPQLSRIVMAMDTAYEEGDDNSYSNIDIWGESPIGFVLVDNWHYRVEFPELKRASIWMAAKWNPEVILIEARASGRSLAQELKRPLPVGSNEPALHANIPIEMIEPEADKYTRAVAVTPLPEAGLVWLPDPSLPAVPGFAPDGYVWVVDYRKELELFPAGRLNDRVDTLVHALTYLRGHGNIVDFYRRLQQHRDAVERAEAAAPGLPGRVAQARAQAEAAENPLIAQYRRSADMWRERLTRGKN
jgi:predicted phage terminase large subunit-like protein